MRAAGATLTKTIWAQASYINSQSRTDPHLTQALRWRKGKSTNIYTNSCYVHIMIYGVKGLLTTEGENIENKENPEPTGGYLASLTNFYPSLPRTGNWATDLAARHTVLRQVGPI